MRDGGASGQSIVGLREWASRTVLKGARSLPNGHVKAGDVNLWTQTGVDLRWVCRLEEELDGFAKMDSGLLD